MSDSGLGGEEGSVPNRLLRHDTILTQLDRASLEILGELRFLRYEIATRPTRVEQTVRRRISLLLVAFGVYLAFQLNDLNSSICSAGAKARRGVDYVAHTKPQDFSNVHLQHLLNARVPRSCDITFPVHAHNGDHWPTPDNLLGWGLFLALMFLLLLWSRVPIWQARWSDHQDPGTPPPPPWPGEEK